MTIAFFIVVILIISAISVTKAIREKVYIWLPDYLAKQFNRIFSSKNEKFPQHIIFLFVDHFEPRVGSANLEKEKERMGMWMKLYSHLASKHRDGDGRYPQHTLFYPYDEINMENLKDLSLLCFQGYGEIELHLHHSNDTSLSLKAKLQNALDSYSKVGALITSEKKPQKAYGFIHGNWALDNSLKDNKWCGVNNELEILKETGCYADFTFPAIKTVAQPAKTNNIYYAKDTPSPKSYDRCIDVKVGHFPTGDLMLVQGPLTIDWGDWRNRFYPTLEDGDIAHYHLPTDRRVDLWINTNIHVIGQDEWIFVKVFTHGAEDKNLPVVLGDAVDRMYSYLEKRYNNGKYYKLHYVTAREAYNIIKAAEANMEGNPNDYRDFIIKPYANTRISCNRLYRLISYGDEEIQLEILEDGPLEIKLKEYEDFQLERIGKDIPYRMICKLTRRNL